MIVIIIRIILVVTHNNNTVLLFATNLKSALGKELNLHKQIKINFMFIPNRYIV